MPCLKDAVRTLASPVVYSLSCLRFSFLSQSVPSNSLLFSILELCVREQVSESVWESWLLQCLETASGEHLSLQHVYQQLADLHQPMLGLCH